MNDRHAPNRQRAAELLRKLRAVTIEAGATEAEALAAAAMARKIADEHGLPLDEDPIVEVRVPIGRVRFRPVDRLWNAIGAFAQVSVVLVRADALEVAYVGRAADTLLAEWLHLLLKRHIDRALDAFKTRAEYRRRRPARRRIAAAAFVEAMAMSLCAKLHSMRSEHARTKVAEAQAWISACYGRLTEHTAPGVNDGRVDGARRAGRQAAAEVAISTPVGASSPAIAGMLGWS